MQNGGKERGGKTTRGRFRVESWEEVEEKEEEKVGKQREIRRTKKKQRPSTTGASTIYGRILLSLFRIGYGASGPMLGKSETHTRGLGRYVV